MENEKNQGGKYLIIIMMLIIIILIGVILFMIATSKDSNLLEDKTIKEIEKKNKEAKEDKESIRSIDTFLKVISSLDYMDAKDIYFNSILSIQNDDNETDYYNPNTRKKFYTAEEDSYDWYGSFGLFYDDNNTYIVNDKGKVLFITNKIIEFYPETKMWELDENVYNEDGLLEKSATIIDEKGNYILTEKDHKLVLEDNKLKPIYTYKLDRNDHVLDGELYDNLYDEQYAYIGTGNYNFIINVKNGKEVYKTEDEIASLGGNFFEIDEDTYFVKNDKLALKVEGSIDNIEASSI